MISVLGFSWELWHLFVRRDSLAAAQKYLGIAIYCFGLSYDYHIAIKMSKMTRNSVLHAYKRITTKI